jgi:hypothetical protein
VTTLTADQLITYLSWAVFLAIFALVTVQAIRRPSRANLDIALLFGAAALVIVIAVASLVGLLAPGKVSGYLAGSAILALPYLLLRLMDDITIVPLRLRRSVEALLILAIMSLWLLPLDRLRWISGLLLLYIICVLAYVIGASIRATTRARGVTRRRLTAMTLGSLFLLLNIGISGLSQWFPDLAYLWRSAADVLGLAAALSYVVGFTPPRWLRRAWQEPDLRAFLERAATLPRLPNTDTIVQSLAQGTAASLGCGTRRPRRSVSATAIGGSISRPTTICLRRAPSAFSSQSFRRARATAARCMRPGRAPRSPRRCSPRRSPLASDDSACWWPMQRARRSSPTTTSRSSSSWLIKPPSSSKAAP